jgi:DNA excision repair protein ERCC-4
VSVRIDVDVFEQISGIPEFLQVLGASIKIERLKAGDYRVGENTILERKSVADLHGSVIDGRFWAQVGALRESSRYPFLLVEGQNIDIGGVEPAAIRGICLATIRLGIRLLRSTDACDSALWIFRLAAQTHGRQRRDRPVYEQQPKLASTPTAEAMLAAIPGISRASARALLERFGDPITVLTASPQALTDVPGIGRQRASAISAAGRSRSESPEWHRS